MYCPVYTQVYPKVTILSKIFKGFLEEDVGFLHEFVVFHEEY
jgi:hypothetical protein